MNKSVFDIWDNAKSKIKKPKVKWKILSSLLVLSIVSSHFIFSNKVVFENDIAINDKDFNKSKFKVPVYDLEAKEKIISLKDYRESKGDFVVLHPENPMEIDNYGLECKILNLNDGLYKMRCYNLSPENKGFGMYTSNTYKVSKNENKDNISYWIVEKVKYNEVFLFGYFFGFLFWLAVFFWPLVFSQDEIEEEDIQRKTPTIMS